MGEHVLPLNIQRENFAIVYQLVEMTESSPVEYSTGELLYGSDDVSLICVFVGFVGVVIGWIVCVGWGWDSGGFGVCMCGPWLGRPVSVCMFMVCIGAYVSIMIPYPYDDRQWHINN